MLTRFFQSAVFCWLGAFSTGLSAGALPERAGEWLSQEFNLSEDFAMTFSRNKIHFKGCKQRAYQLTFSQPLGETFLIETSLHYGKGVLSYGVLNQRVRSRGYEMKTWWQAGEIRMGVGSRVRQSHSLETSSQGRLELPQSHAIKAYIELPVVNAGHIATVTLTQETWDAGSNKSVLGWRRLKDNQLSFNYLIAF